MDNDMICPVCGKKTVAVGTGTAWLTAPMQIVYQRQCGCGWIGPRYGVMMRAEGETWQDEWARINGISGNDH